MEERLANLFESKFDEFNDSIGDRLALMELNNIEQKIESENNIPGENIDQLSLPAPVINTVEIDHKPWKKLALRNRVGEYGLDQCEKKEKIYFLKTSKTGSTTMANILMRFGFERPGTNFLFGETPNGAMFFLNGYLPFAEEVCFLGRSIVNRPKFDISYVHMR